MSIQDPLSCLLIIEVLCLCMLDKLFTAMIALTFIDEVSWMEIAKRAKLTKKADHFVITLCGDIDGAYCLW